MKIIRIGEKNLTLIKYVSYIKTIILKFLLILVYFLILSPIAMLYRINNKLRIDVRNSIQSRITKWSKCEVSTKDKELYRSSI